MAKTANVPRFATVPDSWKHPLGPYQQAPPEYGSEWWLINPFVVSSSGGKMPWEIHGVPQPPPADKPLPEGFAEIFGKRPRLDEFGDEPNPSEALRIATVYWEQNLKYFKRAGVPEGYEAADITLANNVLAKWGLGSARFYEGRYGWFARFPNQAVKTASSFRFEMPAYTTITLTHFAVSTYQIHMLTDGVQPGRHKHPFVPDFLWDSVPE